MQLKGQFLVNFDQLLHPKCIFWTTFLLKKMSIRKLKIFIDMFSLIKQNILIKSRLKGVIVGRNFQKIDPHFTHILRDVIFESSRMSGQ